MILDVLRLYERWKLENVVVRPGLNGDEAWACCPFHSESRPSFSVNMSTGKWHCLGCHARGRSIEALIAQIEGLTTDAEVAHFVRTAAVKQADEIRLDLRKILQNKKDRMSARAQVDTTSTDEWRLYNSYRHRYLIERGFTEETIHEHCLGYDIGAQAVTIPVFEHGACRFMFRRSVRPDARPKYLYPSDVTKSNYLWGLDQTAASYYGQRIYVTEGSLDALWLRQMGLEHSVAILGSFISEQQVAKLAMLSPSEIVMFFDNDAAGYDATKHAGKMFLDHGLRHVYYLRYPRGSGDDPQGCTHEQIQRMIKRKKHFNYFNLHPKIRRNKRIATMLNSNE